MKLCVIHLTDIHIKDKKSLNVDYKKIVAGSLSHIKESNKCLLAITGDIAYSGTHDQYSIANELIQCLVKEIKELTELECDIAIVPGNHDCDFSKNPTIRQLIIKNLCDDPELANDPEVVKNCTSVQENFFEFRKNISTLNTLYEDPLWTEALISVGDKKIIISLVNASWMSSLKETPGSLIFPIKNYISILDEGHNTFRITMIHHPLNWYCQKSYHDFKKHILSSSSLILSGHEHVPLSSEITSKNTLSTLCSEGSALVSHQDNEESGFSTLLIDLEKHSVNIRNYIFTNGSATLKDTTDHILGKNHIPELEISDRFIEELSDPGANFTLGNKYSVSMSDLYTNVKLECDSEEETTLDKIPILGEKIYITGEELSGKTKLLHKIYLNLNEQDILAIYVDITYLKNVTKDGIKKLIDKQCKFQYKKDGILNSFTKSKSAVLIDNYDTISSRPKGLGSIFDTIDQLFGTVIIVGAEPMGMNSEFLEQKNSPIWDYKKYKIKDFGHEQRFQLIQKWCSHEEYQSNQEFEKKVHSIESMINSVLGKNLIPSRPIYLLTLLQSSSTTGKSDLQSSGMSYYYQYLITKSLSSSGVGADEFDEYFNYISGLSWLIHSSETDSIEDYELVGYNKDYSEKYTTIHYEGRIRVLSSAKIIYQSGSTYKFYYPYVKYFFLGKYLADNIEDSAVTSLIKHACGDLCTRKNSNLVLFLTHHKNSSWVVDEISKNLSSCFSRWNPTTLDNGTHSLNELIITVSDIVISDLDVDKHQRLRRELQDASNFEPSDEELIDSKENDTEEAHSISELFNLIRSTEVLGQILKNYYGSITRDNKAKYLSEVFNAPLRLLTCVMGDFIDDPNSFVSKIESEISKRHDELSKDDIRKISSQFISLFISSMCTGIIIRIAESAGTRKLKEDVIGLVKSNPTNSYKLVLAAIALTQPNKIPFEDLSKLSKQLDRRSLAFNVLQQLVLYRTHMFHTSMNERQKLGSLVGINFQPASNTKAISFH